MKTQVRQRKVLNLDDIVAGTPQSVIVWRGEEHAVADMSVDTYLRYLQMEETLKGTMESTAPAQQMQLYLDIFALMVPSLPLDDIKGQPLAVVTQLANFVMGVVSDLMGGDKEATAETGSAEWAGVAGEAAETDSPLG